MSMFDLKGSASNNWNYSDNTKENYTEFIQGTVVQIDNPQSVNFGTGKPEFWDDGNPKRNLRMTLLQQDGEEIQWTFAPHARSNARKAIVDGMDAYDPNNNGNMKMLLGKIVTVWTQAGSYNSQRPRPWNFRIDGDGDQQFVRGLVDLSQQTSSQQVQPVTPSAPVAPASPPVTQVAPAAPPASVVQQVAKTFGVRLEEVPQEQVPVSVYDEDIPF